MSSGQIFRTQPCNMNVADMKSHVRTHFEIFQRQYPNKLPNRSAIIALKKEDLCKMIFLPSQAPDDEKLVQQAAEAIAEQIADDIDSEEKGEDVEKVSWLLSGDCDRNMTIKKMVKHILANRKNFPQFKDITSIKGINEDHAKWKKFKKDQLCDEVLAIRQKLKVKQQPAVAPVVQPVVEVDIDEKAIVVPPSQQEQKQPSTIAHFRKGECAPKENKVDDMVQHILDNIRFFPKYKDYSKSALKKLGQQALCDIVLAIRNVKKVPSAVQEEVKQIIKEREEEAKEKAKPHTLTAKEVSTKIKEHCGQNIQFFSNLKKQMEYQPQYFRNIDPKSILSRHEGQRKLFLTELYFLTNYGHLSNTVVYPGAAHGYHIPLLSSLFPNHTFYLYDPSKFFDGITRDTTKIQVFNKLFLEEDAKDPKYKSALLISDIRSIKRISEDDLDVEKSAYNIAKNLQFNSDLKTRVIKSLSAEKQAAFNKIKLGKVNLPKVKKFLLDNLTGDEISEIHRSEEIRTVTEENVILDMDLQAEFINNMKPKKAMIKFRVPYGADEYCNTHTKDGKCLYPFFEGDLLLQPYAPLSSTEMRLITSIGENKKFEYDCKEIENKMFYLNAEIRNKLKEVDGVEMTWDQRQECAIIEEFKIKNPTYAKWDIQNLLDNIVANPFLFNKYVKKQTYALQEAVLLKELKYARQYENDFKSNLANFLKSEPSKRQFIEMIVKESIRDRKYFEPKIQTEAQLKTLVEDAFSALLNAISVGRVDITSIDPNQLVRQLEQFSKSSISFKNYLEAWSKADRKDLVHWLQNKIYSITSHISKQLRLQTEREEIKFTGEFKPKKRAEYIARLIEKKNLFPEIANLTEEQIYQLEAQKIKELIFKKKAEKVQKEIQRIEVEKNSILDSSANLNYEIRKIYDSILHAIGTYYILLMMPQSKENDLELQKAFEGEERMNYFEPNERNMLKYGVSPQINADLMRHILTRVLPYEELMSLKPSTLFAKFSDFLNEAGSPFNDASINNKLNETLPESIKEKVKKLLRSNAGIETDLKEKVEHTFLTRSSMNLLRGLLMRAAQVVGTDDKNILVNLDGEAISTKANNLAIPLYLSPELGMEDKIINSFIWLIVGGTDWLDRQSVDLWDVYSAIKLFLGPGQDAAAQAAKAWSLFQIEAPKVQDEKFRKLKAKINNSLTRLNPPVFIGVNSLNKLAAVIRALLAQSATDENIVERANLFNQDLPITLN